MSAIVQRMCHCVTTQWWILAELGQPLVEMPRGLGLMIRRVPVQAWGFPFHISFSLSDIVAVICQGPYSWVIRGIASLTCVGWGTVHIMWLFALPVHTFILGLHRVCTLIHENLRTVCVEGCQDSCIVLSNLQWQPCFQILLLLRLSSVTNL